MTFLIGRVSSPVRILRSFAFMIVLVSTILLVFNIPEVRASQISWSNVYSPGGNAGGALIVSSVNDGGVIGADAGTSYGETMYQVSQTSGGGGSHGHREVIFEDKGLSVPSPYRQGGTDPGFYVPTFGQTTTSLTVSFRFHVTGYIGADISNILGGHANAHLSVRMYVYQDDNHAGMARFYELTLTHIDVDCSNTNSRVDCSNCNWTGVNCWGTQYFDGDQTLGGSASLIPGHKYHVGLTFASYIDTGQTTANAYSCFWYTTGNGWTCQKNYSGDPSGSTSCPPSISSPCYYVSWLSANYALSEPDFTLVGPNSFSITGCGGAIGTMSVFSNDGFSSPVSLTGSSPNTNLHFSYSPNIVTPPANFVSTTTLAITDSNPSDSGTFSATSLGSATDANAFVSTSQWPVSVTVTPSYDFTVTASPSTFTIPYASTSSTQLTLQETQCPFSGTVSLSVDSNPPGNNNPSTAYPYAYFLIGSNHVTSTSSSLTPGGSSAITLYVQTTPATTVATYHFTVSADFAGTGGPIHHTTDITVTTSIGTTLSNDPSSPDWSIRAPTWRLVNGYLDGSGTSAEIVSASSLASDRTVTVKAITLTPGSQPWYTAWIRGKYTGDCDAATLILDNGPTLSLDLSIATGCTAHHYTANTNLPPVTSWHTITMIFTGNEVKVYVDGALYIDAVDSWIGTLGADKVALASWGPSESQFDAMSIA